ncbi:hypothetical protein FAUST_3256 [Fusarium austroamericanum]|uniref:Uncharacterized protein n=1 Tax=Fusarium austroamericanum TaxID=282268 RepID=A0AAN6C5E6_FUSAU|nr:hypothetical protein FAUST_3256 [Fusarium austroamericanum]
MASLHPPNGNHPSESIPDAAYPNDSPFRSDNNSPQSMVSPLTIPPPSASGSASTPSSQPPVFGASVPAYSSPVTPSPSWSPEIPSSPPPPYDPTRPPPIYYSPLEPPSSLSSPPPQYPPSTPWPYQQAGSFNGSIHGAPHKMGPVAAARARRRRKMQLIALALCAVIMIIFALIMGVLMGIVRLQWKGDDDDD